MSKTTSILNIKGSLLDISEAAERICNVTKGTKGLLDHGEVSDPLEETSKTLKTLDKNLQAIKIARRVMARARYELSKIQKGEK